MEPGDGLDNDCDGKIDEEVRDGKDNDGDGKIDEEKRNGQDDDGDGRIDEDFDKSDCGDAHNYLRDDVDKLKGDMDKMLDIMKAMQELAGPMGQSVMDLRGLADPIAGCCS